MMMMMMKIIRQAGRNKFK